MVRWHLVPFPIINLFGCLLEYIPIASVSKLLVREQFFVQHNQYNICIYMVSSHSSPVLLHARKSSRKWKGGSFFCRLWDWTDIYLYFTSNPSPRRHSLCNSISLWQSASSSPLAKMQASRACLVSGQQQHIFFPDFIPTFCELLHFFSSSKGGDDGVDDELPIVEYDTFGTLACCVDIIRPG